MKMAICCLMVAATLMAQDTPEFHTKYDTGVKLLQDGFQALDEAKSQKGIALLNQAKKEALKNASITNDSDVCLIVDHFGPRKNDTGAMDLSLSLPWIDAADIKGLKCAEPNLAYVEASGKERKMTRLQYAMASLSESYDQATLKRDFPSYGQIRKVLEAKGFNFKPYKYRN